LITGDFDVQSLFLKSKLTVVVPCYNEERTLVKCIERVLQIEDANLSLELIVVDDYSRDDSYAIALELAKSHRQIRTIRHEKNMGKGAALRTGFKLATGHFVAVQDADLEYDPQDLKRLLAPLLSGDADVVLGSRFLSPGVHRVFYFWHYLGNLFLTFLSNMFTDLNLTDMETCYKVFRRELIQSIDLCENRFGFEPEIVAKIAHLRVRIYEMGISYYGRTYEEGKKIGLKDGLRALYCIFRYNAHKAPLPLQLILYFFIGGFSAFANLLFFIIFWTAGLSSATSALSAFALAALLNYFLCIIILFRHKARWNSITEFSIYLLLFTGIGLLDLSISEFLISIQFNPLFSKSIASATLFLANFLGRRFLVFPEPTTAPWR
jgi:dolichol-phosphate mannosyltransferase